MGFPTVFTKLLVSWCSQLQNKPNQNKLYNVKKKYFFRTWIPRPLKGQELMGKQSGLNPYTPTPDLEKDTPPPISMAD